MRIFNPDSGKWEYVNLASQIRIQDTSNSYESDTVESALQEISANRVKDRGDIDSSLSDIKQLQESVDWLKVNGASGGAGAGGAVMPTITSDFADNQVVVKGTKITLPIFFSSANLGNGVLYLSINGVEINTFTLKQGSNSIDIGALTELRSKISVYAKDRAGLLSNELSWNIINGGIGLTLDFDYYADYAVDKDILMRYYIDTDEKSPILNVKVDDTLYTVTCKSGYNEYYFTNLSAGVHKISVKATSGNYISETYDFNLVVVNSENLYVSTTFNSGSILDFGSPITIPYRLSYKDDTEITIDLILNDENKKTLVTKRGSYAWTLNDVEEGDYKFNIKAVLGDQTSTIEGNFKVKQGEYTPIQIDTAGLKYRMLASEKSNQDEDKNCYVYKDDRNTITMNLYNFNYNTNGWVNGSLLCNGGAYAVIDLSPWEDNADYSSTIEILFKSVDMGNEASIIEYQDKNTNKGFHISLSEAKMSSISQSIKAYINPNEWTTVSFEIDRKNRFAKIFVNGICTKAFKLTDSGSGTSAILEDFAFDGKIYINCDSNLDNTGYCEIKDIRIYNRNLDDDTIVYNYLSQAEDFSEQKKLNEFNFNNTSLPVMRMYGDMTNMTNEVKKTMRIKYDSPNTEKYGQPFDLNYCQVYWQGTSSLDYVLKNFNIELKDENMKDYYYSPYPNGIPEHIFCLKADYMESSHSRNVGIARFANDCIFTTKNPAQLENENIRNSINGFPIILYINDEMQGIYNFNIDRYSNNTYGYTDESKHLVYEVSANSDTTAGAFFKYGSTNLSIDNTKDKTELQYYQGDFMCLYPPTRRAGNDDFAEIKRVVEFVDSSGDEDFRKNLKDYFNVEYLIKYYIFVNVFGAVDSLGKNMKLATWDGKIWYTQIYDCDTTIGLDNTGYLKFESYIETDDENTYNTTNSRLWSRLKLLFADQIKSTYETLRLNGLTLDNLYKYIVDDQMEKIPATFYNKDMQTKYLNFGKSYLYALQGKGKQQIKTWLQERLIYLDTLFDYTVSTSDYVTVRSSKLGKVYLDIQAFTPMYFRIKWRNESTDESIVKKRVLKGETVRFEYNMPTATDQEIRIYGGQYIKSLGDMSNLEPTTLLLANAKKLTDLVCHSSNLINVSFSSSDKDVVSNIKNIDLSKCTNLGSGDNGITLLDVSTCTNIDYINIQDTALQGIIFAEGSSIREIWYPKTIQSIVIQNAPKLKIVGLEDDNSCKLLSLTNCPQIEAFGDRKLDITSNTYKYPNGYFLKGINSIYLDNSYLKEIIGLEHCVGMTSLIIKNNSKVKSVVLGHNTYNSNTNAPSPNQGLVNLQKDNVVDLKIETSNCSSLTDLYFAGYGQDNYQGYTSYPRFCTFTCKELDISNSQFSNVYFNISSLILALKLNKNVKTLVMNDLLHMKSKTTNEIKYLYGEDTLTANYDNVLSANDGIRGGSCILNIWCPQYAEYEPTFSSTGVWDFKGLNITDFLCTRHNYKTRYSDDSIIVPKLNLTLKNLNLVAHNYSLSLRTFTKFENINLNYSEYIGATFNNALQNITEDVQVQLPNNLDKISYAKCMVKGAHFSKIAWTNNLLRKYLSKGIDFDEISDTILAEMSVDNPVDVRYNGTSNNICPGYNHNYWLKNNLYYVDNLIFPETTTTLGYWLNQPETRVVTIKRINRVVFPNGNKFDNSCGKNGNYSILEYIGEIVTNSSDFYVGLKNNTIIESLPRIVNNLGEEVPYRLGDGCFQNASKLSGKLTFTLGANVSLSNSFSGTSIEEVTFNNSNYITSLNNTFNNLSTLKKVTFNGGWDNVTNMDSTFYTCSNLTVIEGITTGKLPSCLTSANKTFYACKQFSTIFTVDSYNPKITSFSQVYDYINFANIEDKEYLFKFVNSSANISSFINSSGSVDAKGTLIVDLSEVTKTSSLYTGYFPFLHMKLITPEKVLVSSTENFFTCCDSYLSSKDSSNIRHIYFDYDIRGSVKLPQTINSLSNNNINKGCILSITGLDLSKECTGSLQIGHSWAGELCCLYINPYINKVPDGVSVSMQGKVRFKDYSVLKDFIDNNFNDQTSTGKTPNVKLLNYFYDKDSYGNYYKITDEQKEYVNTQLTAKGYSVTWS